MNSFFWMDLCACHRNSEAQKGMERLIQHRFGALLFLWLNSSWRLKPEWHELFLLKSSVFLCFGGKHTNP